MKREALITVAIGLLAALQSRGDENLKPPVEVTSTERFDLAPTGTLRVNESYGDLYVEGWDRPQVELTVTKFLPYEYELAHPERPARELEALQVVGERTSPSELAISTRHPERFGWVWHPTLPVDTAHVMLEYQIHAPRGAHLVIGHKVGYVSVSGITGDIDATCHRGDIVLWLPAGGRYSIDAKNKLGKVSSDFAGSSSAQFLVGQKFIGADSGAPQRLHLRMGFGGITLKPILEESGAKGPQTGAK